MPCDIALSPRTGTFLNVLTITSRTTINDCILAAKPSPVKLFFLNYLAKKMSSLM